MRFERPSLLFEGRKKGAGRRVWVNNVIKSGDPHVTTRKRTCTNPPIVVVVKRIAFFRGGVRGGVLLVTGLCSKVHVRAIFSF